MTRHDALLRLHKDLLARKEHLWKKLARELAYLHDGNAAGDSADMAFEAGGDDMSSRLAELQDRELNQIERALARCKLGAYGICAGGCRSCQKNIPLARLNALPYTPFCINCERDMERSPDGRERQSRGSWSRISDAQTSMQDRRIDFSEMERVASGNPRG